MSLEGYSFVSKAKETFGEGTTVRINSSMEHLVLHDGRVYKLKNSHDRKEMQRRLADVLLKVNGMCPRPSKDEIGQMHFDAVRDLLEEADKSEL